MKYILLLPVLLYSCTTTPKENSSTKNYEKFNPDIIPSPPPPAPYNVVSYTDSIKAIINYKTNLTHSGIDNVVDSIVAVVYIGFNEGKVYYPINNKGQWISSITQRKVLNKQQSIVINEVIANSKSYENAEFVNCFEPRLALIYYKKQQVIGQTIICLECYALGSTLKTGNKTDSYHFNKEAGKLITLFQNELFINQ